MTQSDQSLVYSVRDIQAMLSCSKSKVYEGLRTGVIPCIRLGKRYIIPQLAFRKWLESAGEGHIST